MLKYLENVRIWIRYFNKLKSMVEFKLYTDLRLQKGKLYTNLHYFFNIKIIYYQFLFLIILNDFLKEN